MQSLKKRLFQTLDDDAGERKVCRFLKAHPQVIHWAFCTAGGHSQYVVPEFRFGCNYRADFVIVFSYSGAFEIHFIELEPPADSVITKGGTPTKRLNSAISQIGDWRRFVERNPMLIRKDLSDSCESQDVLGFFPRTRPFNYATGDLDKPGSSVKWQYHVIIGRREKVTRQMREKINQFHFNDFVEICTYDRLLDIAANLDESAANPDRSIYLPGTRDRGCR
jgi:hypothetical protein